MIVIPDIRWKVHMKYVVYSVLAQQAIDFAGVIGREVLAPAIGPGVLDTAVVAQ